MSSLVRVDSTVLTIAKYTNYENDIKPVLETNQAIYQSVCDQWDRYRTINVAESLKGLQAVGELLSVAYMGTKGFSCNKHVVGLLADYQTLGKDSQLACHQFLMATLKALQYHRYAIQSVSNGRADKAIKFLAMTSTVAGKMSDISATLVDKATAMCKLAVTAIQEAANDETISTENKARIREQIAELEAKQARLEASTAELKAQLEAAVEKESKAAQEADDARNVSFAITLVSACVSPVLHAAKAVAGQVLGVDYVANPIIAAIAAASAESQSINDQVVDVERQLAAARDALQTETDEATKQTLMSQVGGLQSYYEMLQARQSRCAISLNTLREQKNGEANSAAQREAIAAAERRSLQDQAREDSADLAESIARLKGTHEQDDRLEKAIAALEVAIKSLGRVKTVFENTRIYWAAVQTHCGELADISTIRELSDDGFEQELADAITSSWYSWLALSKINYTATRAMEGVMGKIDSVMDDLPSREEARQRLPALINTLEVQLQLELQVGEEATTLY